MAEKNILDELKEKGYSEDDLREALNSKNKEAEQMLKDPSAVNKVLIKASELIKKWKNIPRVGRHFKNAGNLCLMVGDYIDGNYTKIPTATVVSILGALIYVVSPIDLIPDVLPVVGILDDALVIWLVYEAAEADINDYCEWKGIW